MWLAGLSSSASLKTGALSSTSTSTSTSPPAVIGAAGSGAASCERLYLVYSWFYFECLAKSMGLERCELGRLTPQYRDEFLHSMGALMDVFVVLVSKHRSLGLTVVKQLVTNLAAFCLDLFALVDKDSVLDLVERFLVPLRSVSHDPVLIELKFTFHTIVADYAYYLDLAELRDLDIAQVQRAARERSEPQQPQQQQQKKQLADTPSTHEATEDGAAGLTSDDSPTSAASPSSSLVGERPQYRELMRSGLLQRLRSDYRLCALLIDDFVHHLSAKEAVIRDAVIDCLRLFLTKSDYDQRWRSAKPLIATALFPLIPALCDEVDVIVALEPRARRNVLMPFLWILHHVPHPLLSALWACEDAEDQLGLLTLLTQALEDFAYAGIRAREGEQATEATYTLAAESIERLLTQSVGSGSRGAAGAGSGMSTYKMDIESLMANVHKTKAFGGSRSRLNPGTAAPAGRRDSTQYNTVSGYNAAAVHSALTAASSPSPPPLLPSASMAPSPGIAALDRLVQSRASLVPGGAAAAHAPAQSAMLSSTSTPTSAAVTAAAAGGGGSSASGGASGSAHPAANAPGSSSAIYSGSGAVGGASSASSAGTLRQLRANLASNRSVPHLTFRASQFRSANSGGGASLSAVHRELMMNLVRFEGALTRQVSRIVLNVLSRFLRAFASRLVNSGEAFLQVLRALTALFVHPQPNSFLLSVFPVALCFVRRYGYALNATAGRAAEFSRLSNAIFRTCSFSSRAVRRHAVAVVYQCLMNEYCSSAQDLTRLQTQFTMELSRMTDGLTALNERCLQQTFSALTLLCDRYGLQADVALDPEQVFHERPGPGEAADAATALASSADFRLRLQSLLGRLTTILGDSMEISRQRALGEDADSATTEALLCQVADAFSHLPEVRIEWLKRLAKHHQQHAAYAEAAQCYLLVAQLAAQRKRDRFAGAGPDDISASELEAIDRVIASYYEACVSQLDLAELYEQCSDVYEALLPYYHHSHDYGRLSKAHLHLHSVFEKLLEANKQQTRMLGTYYRVGFYGQRFGPRLDGREFIYKQPKITRLSEIAARMKALYAKQLACPVRILPDSNPVDRSKLDPDECVMQVTFVTPYFGHSTDDADVEDDDEEQYTNDVARGFHDSTSSPSSTALRLRPTLLTYAGERPRASFIEQHSFLAAFKFSTPFTATGKAFGSVTEQQKRNTVLYVQHPFPAILTAQLVCRKTETILSPIESATEDVNARTQSILELLDSQNASYKTLTQILAGSVATQVHGGAKEICIAFLRPEDARAEPGAGPVTGAAHSRGSDADDSAAQSPSSASPSSRAKLRSALVAFLDACSRALEVNSRLCTLDSEREFQANMDQAYELMLDEMTPYLQQSRAQQQQQQQGSGTEGGGSGPARSHGGSDSSSSSASSDGASGGDAPPGTASARRPAKHVRGVRTSKSANSGSYADRTVTFNTKS